jgi:hypothetical protein
MAVGMQTAGYTAPMFRRWFIRSLALTLLTLCVVAWVGSYWARVWRVGITFEHCDYFLLENGSTLIDVAKRVAPVDYLLAGWHLEKAYPVDMQMNYEHFDFRLAGFAVIPSTVHADNLAVFFPLWFPTLLSALLVVFAWRKTRAKPVGGAFPVEPAKSGEKQP